MPARTSPTLHPPSPPTVSIVVTSTLRVKIYDYAEKSTCDQRSFVDHYHLHDPRIYLNWMFIQMGACTHNKCLKFIYRHLHSIKFTLEGD